MHQAGNNTYSSHPAPRPEPLEAPYPPGSLDPARAAVDTAAVAERHPAYAKFGQELGNTSLIEVPGVPGGATVLAKCEWENPAGSIKDRVAHALLGSALQQHGDRPPGELRVLEYSGGSLANALSRLCADLGVPARFVLSSASPRSLLGALAERGARVDLVDKERGFLEVVREALRIAAAEPGWTLLYQHRNPANVLLQERTTGAELIAQLGGRVPDAWVASIGTGGTLIGVLRALRARFPAVRAVGVTPAELPYGSEEPPNGQRKYAGSGGMGHGIRQPFVTLYDDETEQRTVSYPRAFAAMGEFHDLTGLRIGSSAAANWLAAKEVAAALPPSATVVTVFPDAGTPEEWEQLGR
ncbi:PLP-dependent cysteine synthase family protein [Streptomyces roseoverticillatus]|uniref:PLP-dependent cysteine synthase family protein n=1 Tax=Streptomyces roseoverticillatus TaxID=66429 RepID=UPI000AC654BF|nr:pyridoxal-phosphate dependent enzyme [Streptomyces roseoverticillatus]